jgi:hypothetical protein
MVGAADPGYRFAHPGYAYYTVWYNYVEQHKSLKGLSPAMASGLCDTLWSMTDLAEMIDAAQPKPGKRGRHKKRLAA